MSPVVDIGSWRPTSRRDASHPQPAPGDVEHTYPEGEFVLSDVANNFDPSVSGLPARVGSVVGTVDLTKAWHKIGIGDTDWKQENTMKTQAILWYLASDGVTPATDMSVALVGRPAPGQGFYSPQLKCSFQVWWTAGSVAPTGALGYRESSDNSHWDTGSLSSADQAPTQPAGSAGSTTIDFPDYLPPYIDLTYTPSNGGTGAVLGGNFTVK